MKKDNYIFPAVFDYADDGISISFPDLPGCFSCAENDEEALYMAKEALRLWLLVAEDEGIDIPGATPLNKVSLDKNQRVVLIDVCLAPYRSAYQNRAVKKTLTIPAWLNDIAVKEGVNFSFALQSALMEQLHIPNDRV